MTFSGPTFKKLREGKGYSISETTAGLVSPQFLRKYEAGKCDISLTNFLNILARINVTLVEFSDVFQEETFDYWLNQATYEATIALIDSDSIRLVNLLKDTQAKLQTTPDDRYRLFCVLVKGWLDEHFYHVTPDYQEIRAYLEKVHTWQRFEFFLATYCKFPVEKDYLKMITTDIIKNKRNKSLDDRYACDFVVHVGLHFYRSGDLATAKQIYEDYFKYSFSENAVDNLLFDIYARYCQGLIRASEGEADGHQQVQEIVRFLDEVVGHSSYANRLNILYHRYQFLCQTKDDPQTS